MSPEEQAMRKRLWALLVGVASVFVAPGAAVGHDHTPPSATLITTTDSAEGAHAITSWASRSGGRCAVSVARGTYGWQGPAVQWIPGTEMAVRFDSRHRPAGVFARAFLFEDPTTGTPIYGEVYFPRKLRKVDVDGRTMWEAVLSPPPWPDMLLEVRARWRDRDGCAGQSASWWFRAGLSPV